MKPLIAITMGDPAGVGPELCLQALAKRELLSICTPVVYGDAYVLDKVARTCGPTFKFAVVGDVSMVSKFPRVPCIVGRGGKNAAENVKQIDAGQISELTGQSSFNYVKSAIDDALAGKVDAVVTGPINKKAWQAAGIKYPGHTELFAEKADCKSYCMLMTSPDISCSLVVCHAGYQEVPELMTRERVLEVIVLTYEAIKRMRGRSPRLAVLGLNPHAGEQGLFGNGEEESIIAPAIEAAREQGIQIAGPLAPDTAFTPSQREQTDAYVCMYHDQGLIPFKALAFDTGVNTTLGLPIVRTSVDHGTALDIAWKGKADPSSMFAAIELAVQLSKQHVG